MSAEKKNTEGTKYWSMIKVKQVNLKRDRKNKRKMLLKVTKSER